jgi:autophagy-related protein 18
MENGFQLWDASADRPISPFVHLTEKILSIQANDRRIIVLTKRKLLVFALVDLEFLYDVDRDPIIGEAGQNLLSGTDEGLCAFLTKDNVVQVLNSITLFPMPPVRCHSSPVTAIAIRGSILVTGSSKGTIIRVFALPSMKLIALFRRGRTETPIRSLFITEDSMTKALFVVAVGDSDTAHLYRLSTDELICSTESEVSVVGSMMSFLPKPYKDAVEAARDFAFIRLRRDSPSRYIAALVDHKRVAVVAEETGFVFVYEINVIKGGECRLVSEHDLLSQAIEFRPRAASVESSLPPTRQRAQILERPSSFESSQTSLKPSSPVIHSLSQESEPSLPALNDTEVTEGDPFTPLEVKKKKKKKKPFENQISEAA